MDEVPGHIKDDISTLISKGDIQVLSYTSMVTIPYRNLKRQLSSPLTTAEISLSKIYFPRRLQAGSKYLRLTPAWNKTSCFAPEIVIYVCLSPQQCLIYIKLCFLSFQVWLCEWVVSKRIFVVICGSSTKPRPHR